MKADTEIKSLDGYEKKLRNYLEIYNGGIYFRGESDDYEFRTPSIAREEYSRDCESMYYNQYLQYTSEENQNDEILTLAKIQHYGGKTRLVDLTINPIVALYFACEGNKDKDGYVYVYIPNKTEVKINSPIVRALTMLACHEYKNPDDLLNDFVARYGEKVEREQFINDCNTVKIIEFNDSFYIDNERDECQQGTFAICGTDLSKLPQNNFAPFDYFIKPVRSFLIPAEYKETILSELKGKGMDYHTVYPEKQSVIKLIDDNVRAEAEHLDLNEYYEVIDMSDVDTKGKVRGIQIDLLITKPISIANIKSIVRKECAALFEKADVIRTFVVNRTEDLISHNYLMRGWWIRPGVTEIMPLCEKDADGFSWDETSHSKITGAFLDEYGFGDDKTELCRYLKLFQYIIPEMEKIKRYIYEDGQKPEMKWSKQALWSDVLYSKNPDLDSLFQEYNDFFGTASAIAISIGKGLRREFSMKKEIDRMESTAKNIQAKNEKWIQELKIKEKDIKQADSFAQKTIERDYVQAIPLSANAINVHIDLRAIVTDMGKVQITGSTNLFDSAELMVSIDGKATGKPFVEEGRFEIELGPEGAYQIGEHHVIDVSLSIPSVQPLTFLKKAGMQYENLTGDFIIRKGLSPIGKMEEEVVLE